MTYRNIHGLSVSGRKVVPINGGSVVVADSGVVPSWYGRGQLHFCNHNLFRLDKDGNVVWQVKRFECGRLRWRYVMKMLKRERGGEGEAAAESAARQPFTSLRTTFVRRGRFHPLHIESIAPEDLSPIPRPDFVLIASAENRFYEVDIDTGVAINVTPIPWAAR